jgi:hypothetical protein
MNWTIIVPGTFLILYGLGLYLWNKRINWRATTATSQQIKYLHYLLLVLTIFSGVLSIIDDISFAGQWTTRIIIWGLLISGFTIYPITDWTERPKIEKYYFRLFSFVPIFTAGFALVPFLGLVVVISLLGRLIEPVKKVYYESNNLRVQSTFIGVMGPPRLDIIEKKGLFDVRLNKSHTGAADIDSIRIDQETSKTLVILYYDKEPFDTVKIKKVD